MTDKMTQKKKRGAGIVKNDKKNSNYYQRQVKVDVL